MGTHWSHWLDKYPLQKKEADQLPEKKQDNFSFNSPIEAQIDLHGLSQKEALRELEYFILRSLANEKRKVLIIHGKGKHSQDEQGVLKPLVAEYLKQCEYVRASGPAKIKDGGAGATWAILKQYNL